MWKNVQSSGVFTKNGGPPQSPIPDESSDFHRIMGIFHDIFSIQNLWGTPPCQQPFKAPLKDFSQSSRPDGLGWNVLVFPLGKWRGSCKFFPWTNGKNEGVPVKFSIWTHVFLMLGMNEPVFFEMGTYLILCGEPNALNNYQWWLFNHLSLVKLWMVFIDIYWVYHITPTNSSTGTFLDWLYVQTWIVSLEPSRTISNRAEQRCDFLRK